MGQRIRKEAKVEKITMVRGSRPIDIRKLSKTEFPAYTNCTPIKPPIIATSSNTSFFSSSTIFPLQTFIFFLLFQPQYTQSYISIYIFPFFSLFFLQKLLPYFPLTCFSICLLLRSGCLSLPLLSSSFFCLFFLSIFVSG
jgi:hypothetical protein